MHYYQSMAMETSKNSVKFMFVYMYKCHEPCTCTCTCMYMYMYVHMVKLLIGAMHYMQTLSAQHACKLATLVLHKYFMLL